MDFSPERLAERLRAWPAPKRYVVLASGGLDSTVLLEALAGVRARLPAPLAVLHFDHGIAADSPRWAAQVERGATALGVPYFRERLEIEPGGALETRARRSRYARLAAWMEPQDCCVAGHHADDQAETFLLQALRGAGPAGLAGMPELACFEPGWLGRPLLAWTRRELATWACAQGLEWIEDPGNLDPLAARNWLRHRVWPALTEYWPAASHTLARSAALAAEGATLLTELAADDLAECAPDDADRLPASALVALRPARRRNLLRQWIRERGLPVPTAAKLMELEETFIVRDPGSRAVLSWRGAEARRFRGMVHVMEPLPLPPPRPISLPPGGYADLGPLGRVALIADPGSRHEPVAPADPASLRFRRGGESLRPEGSAHHRTLKNLLQEGQVLPWMRFRLPLLYLNDTLAAVGGVAMAEELSARGWTFVWDGAPPIQ